MAHRFLSSTPQPNAHFGHHQSFDESLFNGQSSLGSSSHRPARMPITDQSPPIRRKQETVQSALTTTAICNDDIIPIDDVSHGFAYESHLGRLCQNVIVVSARHPHSFFLQTVDDLTQCDNFFSKMNEFYNRCFDAQRLAITKATLRANLCCVARDEKESDVWNRAQLLEYHADTDQCSLLLVDLGTWQECVPRSNLRHILVPFQSECVRSVPCRLAGIAPAKPEKTGLWSEYAITTFRNVIDNVPTEVEVLDRSPNGSYFVNLFVTYDTFVCVNDFLLHHKIAMPVDDCKTLQPKELDPITHEPLLAIIYEFNLQGELLIEEIKATQLKRREDQEKQLQREVTRDLSAVRIFDIPSSSSCKKLIFARYNNWVMVPWFSISTLFEPPLAESTIERFAMLYKFSPVQLTPLTNGLLCGRLQKCLAQMAVTSKCLAEAKQTSIALYSIDCVRKLLLNHGLVNPFIFDRLDEAREAEMKQDTEFWQLPSQSQSSMDGQQFHDASTDSKTVPAHGDPLAHRLERLTMSSSQQRLRSAAPEKLPPTSHLTSRNNFFCAT